MQGRDVSYFRCDHCGTAEPTTAIEYDGLGYPVCPACGVHERPATTTATRMASDQATLPVEPADSPSGDAGQFQWISPE